MIFFGERCYSNQYDEISDDEISGFANTTKFPTTKFPTTKFPTTKFPTTKFLTTKFPPPTYSNGCTIQIKLGSNELLKKTAREYGLLAKRIRNRKKVGCFKVPLG